LTDESGRLTALLAGREHANPYELFHDVDDDFWFWLNTEGFDRHPELQRILPGLPSPALQQRWTGGTGMTILRSGFDIYRTLRDLITEQSGQLDGPILDFGCGYGRVIRYFMKDLPASELWGTDYTQELVDFCVASNPWLSFNRNEAWPPLPYPDRSVRFLYAYSVFSHFGEPMHWAWLREFLRVLQPGGYAALSIRPRGFIGWCEKQRGPDASPAAAPITKTLYRDSEGSLAAYDRGEFCFSPYDPVDPDAWWGEAVIPRAYIEREWSSIFEVVKFQAGLGQQLAILRKPL
jgi:SAM-dependent methyltransferase